MNRLLAIARKELWQLRRDRLTLAMAVMIPVLQLLLFGFAIDTDVRHMPMVVYDQDRSPTSRAIVHRMTQTGYYDLVGHVEGYEELTRALTRADANVGLVLPANLDENVQRGTPTAVQLVVDGSDPMTVGSATQTAVGVVTAFSQDILVEQRAAQGQQVPPQPIRVQTATWYNPELRSSVNIVPGLIGVILTMTMVMLTAMAVARERERGTLEALIVSPVRRIELVLGKIAPYIMLGYVQMTLVLFAGSWVFDVPIRGSLALIYVLSAAFIAVSLGIGLVFSTVAKTQQQAMQMSFFFLLPNILLSGFMFPFDGMPRVVQAIAQALPLTHYLRVVRGILLRGAGWQEVRTEFLWLCVMLAVVLLIAALRFKKKLL